MIRLTGKTAQGRDFILLGLDRENINRLTSGKPIVCRKETVNIERDVMIVFGETLGDVVKELEQNGIVVPREATR